jgi:hypothetical protein
MLPMLLLIYLSFMLADSHDELTSLMPHCSNVHLNLGIAHAKIPAKYFID